MIWTLVYLVVHKREPTWAEAIEYEAQPERGTLSNLVDKQYISQMKLGDRDRHKVTD